MQKCQKLASPRYQKIQKLAGPPSRKNAKNSKVRSHGKISKTRRSAVKEKCQKLEGPQSEKISKSHRSAVKEKFLKLAGPRSQKNAKKITGNGKCVKISRFAVTQKC